MRGDVLRKGPSPLTTFRAGRLVGVDVARFVALAGMAATHIFPGFTTDGALHRSHEIASGRAAALFAVLAGVSLVLATRRRDPLAGRSLWAAQSGALARAGVLLVLGLLLGLVDSPPLVILAYYALLFAIGSVFLGLGARALAALAVVSALVSPVASHLLRQRTDGFFPAEPGGDDLFVELFLTGTYPALTWTAYLFAGMAVGRTDLRRWRVAFVLVVLGAATAVAATVASDWALAAVGGREELTAPPLVADVDRALDGGLYGTTPRGDADWLAVSAPHTGTTFDLVHTTGTSLLVLGTCLLLVRVLPAVLMLPFAAAGSMSLTLYSAHVLALAEGSPLLGDDHMTLWVGHVAVALVFATAWRAIVGQGPLERVTAAAGRAGRALVSEPTPGHPR